MGGCKKVCAGKLRYSIQIFNKSLTANNCDADISTTLKHSVKADITVKDVVSSCILAKNNTNLNEVATHTFTIRYKSNITSDDIVRYDNKYFKIVGYIDPDERKRWLNIHCIEKGLSTNSRNII